MLVVVAEFHAFCQQNLLHTEAIPAPSTKCEQVLFKFWIVNPSLWLELKRSGEYFRVRMQKIRGLHDWCAAWDDPLVVNQVFSGGNAWLTRRHAMSNSKTFVDDRGLQLLVGLLWQDMQDIRRQLTRYGNLSNCGNVAVLFVVCSTDVSSLRNRAAIS